MRRALEGTVRQPIQGPQTEPAHTSTQNCEQARTIVPKKEQRGHFNERRGSTPIRVHRDTRHNTNEEEWMEEEQSSGDQLQMECVRESVLQQADEPVASQPVSEQPDNDRASQPEARRSTREKRPTRMLMYDSLGQASYQPVCNTVGAYGPPSVPIWPMQTYPVTYHPAFQTLPYPVPHPILPYNPAMQYAAPF